MQQCVLIIVFCLQNNTCLINQPKTKESHFQTNLLFELFLSMYTYLTYFSTLRNWFTTIFVTIYTIKDIFFMCQLISYHK